MKWPFPSKPEPPKDPPKRWEGWTLQDYRDMGRDGFGWLERDCLPDLLWLLICANTESKDAKK